MLSALMLTTYWGDNLYPQRTTAVAVQDERPEKAANSRAGLSHHGSPVLGSVGERWKEMCWQKLTQEFFDHFFKERNVMFRMVFSCFYSLDCHSSILAWKIPWTEEPSRLQFIGSQKVRQDLATKQQQSSEYYLKGGYYLELWHFLFCAIYTCINK